MLYRVRFSTLLVEVEFYGGPKDGQISNVTELTPLKYFSANPIISLIEEPSVSEVTYTYITYRPRVIDGVLSINDSGRYVYVLECQ